MSKKIDPVVQFLDQLDDKVKNEKPLNFWDRRVLGLLKSQELGHSTPRFVNDKIYEIVKEKQAFIEKKKSQSK
jgi:hypothetical protein